ncbi:MAG: CAAX protease [Leptolyngbya sp. LCM1.Bin17]|nr:MAG: CAAX protease [Leptolyngbya sp. LCM1.Bin17]
MISPTPDTLWQVLEGVLTLDPSAFRAVQQFPPNVVSGLTVSIVFLAGFSQALAQGIILFVNRVRPLRFAISLILAAMLFVVGYWFWAVSIWFSSRWFLDAPIPWQTVAHSLALSYLPLVLSFLGAMPYLGVPILRLLAVWNLLAVVVGFTVLAGLSAGQVVWQVGLGWLVFQVLQQTVGQPIVSLGRWLTNRVAGVKLVVNRAQLQDLVGAYPLGPTHSRAIAPAPASPAPPSLPPDSDPAAPASPSSSFGSGLFSLVSGWHRQFQRLWLYIGLAVLALGVAISLDPLREAILAWHGQTIPAARLAVDLLWIGAIALVVGALLAPLEALGWWAGWYGDPVDTLTVSVEGAPAAPNFHRQRFIIYLDGVNQATADYQPAVAQYLIQLEQRLPASMVLVKGLMPYSVLNRALTQDRPLAFFWRWVEAASQRLRLGHWVGMVINLRNILIVTVSADPRYGPIYNQGIAQQAYESLLRAGYPPDGGVPITLIGYSGGGQIAMGIMPFLKQALKASIEVISLGGAISGNMQALEVEQLYHLAGSKDNVERLGAIMFPRRWAIAPLSYWNRAKRKGKISFIPLGPVGHQVPGGIVDDHAFLPDGRSHLEQTLQITREILVGDLRQLLDLRKIQVLTPGNYYRFKTLPFNHGAYYPAGLMPPYPWYQPVGDWVGRLILPDATQRATVDGVFLELLHAPPAYRAWVGQVVILRWAYLPEMAKRFQAVTRDIHFSAEAEYSHQQGLILPSRLNHWRMVTPLESLAGAHPVDDIMVKLPAPVQVTGNPTGPVNTPEQPPPLVLTINREPIQVSGRYYGLVQFLGPLDDDPDCYRVVHYNPATGQFNGLAETVRLPQVVPDVNDTAPAVNSGIEQNLLNQTGWYIYGALTRAGDFVVQALRPRRLFQMAPTQMISGISRGYRYLRRQSWNHLEQKKNTIESVLISPRVATTNPLAHWKLGDQALLVHVYGGIGGAKREPAVRGPIYFGHFAYGLATVVQDPITQELQFDICYHQVYTHNRRGLVAGVLDWSLYMGDRQWGFLGTRPVSDILIKLPAYTQRFTLDQQSWSALDDLCQELEVMTARYRTGDGTGVTYVGPANNCAQDSNQAMYASAKYLEDTLMAHQSHLKAWEKNDPAQAQQFRQLLRLRKSIQQELLPFGSARADWDAESESLGSNLSDFPLKTLGRGLISWRTMLPRKASDTIARLCLRHGATLWVLRTNQVGGNDPEIEPIAPITL